MRGEFRVGALWRDVDSGSPPRAWGVQGHMDRIRRRHRFTPTCVGSSLADLGLYWGL